jgi:hypothetical protein
MDLAHVVYFFKLNSGLSGIVMIVIISITCMTSELQPSINGNI